MAIARKQGYKFNGLELGQKLLYCGEECVIIAFDEESFSASFAINKVLHYEKNQKEYKIKNSVVATAILEGYEESDYTWTNTELLEVINNLYANGKLVIR